MTVIYLPFDLFFKPVSDDQEVWFGILFSGWAAKWLAIPHWFVYAWGAYGFFYFIVKTIHLISPLCVIDPSSIHRRFESPRFNSAVSRRHAVSARNTLQPAHCAVHDRGEMMSMER